MDNRWLSRLNERAPCRCDDEQEGRQDREKQLFELYVEVEAIFVELEKTRFAV
jgi:hypothetical protein